MPAIGAHHTGVSTGAWDAGAVKKRVKEDQPAGYYAKIFAWKDPDGDVGAKGTYKMPHHEVSEDGTPGPANMKACSSAMGAINGARGGADMPDADRMGVHRHIAAHMMDGDMEPPELKGAPADNVERRTVTFTEFRVAGGDGEPEKLVGHAAVFDQETDLGMFRERIARGAFRKTIREADVRALFNHDSNYVLGRNKAGTLRLKEDEEGLAVEITPPETGWAADLKTSMRRGDIDQMSFGFEAIKEDWLEEAKKSPLRTLLELKLWDVSVVTFPAYPQTSVAVRQHIAALAERSAEPEVDLHSDEKREEPSPTGHSARERELELLAFKL